MGGISRDHWHKRRATGGKRAPIRMKRKFELGRPAAMTKLGPMRVHPVRVRGGNKKFRALRMGTGNFSWGSESITRKTRIIDVVYNAANNELVRTKTLVKNAIVVIDATPFRQWYESHYGVKIGLKKGMTAHAGDEDVKYSGRAWRKRTKRQKGRTLEKPLEAQFVGGRLLAKVTSRPGQCGRCDGQILEGPELHFHQKMMTKK